MATPIKDNGKGNSPKAKQLAGIMGQLMNFTSPRHVLRWLEVNSRNRAEMIDSEMAVLDKADPHRADMRKRIRRHTLIANGLKQLLTDLDTADPDDDGTPNGDGKEAGDGDNG